MPSALGLRRDNHHFLRPTDSTHHHQQQTSSSSSSSSPSSMDLHLHLQSFQNQIAKRLTDLGTQDFLSLSWIRRLLLSFLCSHEEFTLILSNHPNPPPLLDRFIQDYYERSVKALDVCNAVRDGIDHIRDWKKLLEIVLCALDNNNNNNNRRLLGEGNFRRAKKALIDLSISMLDGKDNSAAALSAQRNRSFGRQNGSSSTGNHSRHLRSLSWSVSRSWSAAKQLLAIGSNLVAPKPSDVMATGGMAAAVFTMNSFLLFVMWVLVAAIPCQDRGLQVHFSIPRQFEWAAPMLFLHDKILEESRKRERRNSCGLLREIYQMDKCVRGMNELADSVQFPLTEEKEGEVRLRVEELRQVYDEISEGLDPLERQVRQVFHRIVHSRTEGLDSMGRHNNHSE